ncbi:MAG: peptidase M4 family protein [Candidatus Viridilinea halotolerans]|uniref:Peptidase M4 family protein n=1 Tax=Candidatus Viridilinea halotolerans TaxID=2491704 RepID=A0A426TZ41_9CHLR|nr:MAG: peptidase M4 family protein [Candidatus Viridilinea halotolerans]
MKQTLALPRRQWPIFLLVLAYLLAALAALAPPTPLRLQKLAPTQPELAWPHAGPRTPEQALAALAARGHVTIDAAFDPLSGVARFVTARHPEARLPYQPTAAEVGKPEALARGFLDQNRALFGLQSAAEELNLLRVEADQQRGFRHLRFAQNYYGLPVYGRQLMVHLDAEDRVVAVNGAFQPDLAVATTPTIAPELAMTTALADLRGQQLLPAELMRIEIHPLPEETRLVVYVDAAGHATLTWQVTIMTASPLGQWSYFINARRPVVVHAMDGVMPIKRRRTFTAQNDTRIPGRLLIDEGERSRDPIAQAAHDGAGKVYDYFYERFGRDSLDDRGMTLVSTVNFGSDPDDADNAAWVGEYNQMIYGDGGRIFKPLPYALDVIAHEFTHGVIQMTSDLIYELQPGALNEAYADIFAVMVDRSNWLIGEDVIKSPPYPRRYLRSLEDPNAGGLYDARNPLRGVGQPATMDEYANLPNTRRADNGGVHVNSGIPNHAHYLIAQAIGRDKTEQIAYRTLTQYLTPTSDFLDAANASARAAADLYGNGVELQAVQQAFAAVGITSAAAPDGPLIDPGDTPAGDPVPPQPQAPLPAGCSELIVAGGFEQDTGWTEVVRGDVPIIDTQLPRNGRRSAWLGGTDQEPLQYIFQDVLLPANATRIELRYARLIHEERVGLLGAFAGDAQFSIFFATSDGEIMQNLEDLPSHLGDDAWHEVRHDVARHAGRTVRLIFASENPRGNISSMFVDDVSLVACTTGTPDAPSAPAGDLVAIRGQAVDASTRRGIAGAQIYVIRPGLSARAAAADDRLTASEVLTEGVSDREGLFATEAPLPRGQSYSVIVIAAGYRPIIADDALNIASDARSPFRVNVELRRGR